jgi:hypothetical protein
MPRFRLYCLSREGNGPREQPEGSRRQAWKQVDHDLTWHFVNFLTSADLDAQILRQPRETLRITACLELISMSVSQLTGAIHPVFELVFAAKVAF